MAGLTDRNQTLPVEFHLQAHGIIGHEVERESRLMLAVPVTSHPCVVGCRPIPTRNSNPRTRIARSFDDATNERGPDTGDRIVHRLSHVISRPSKRHKIYPRVFGMSATSRATNFTSSVPAATARSWND